MKNVPIVVKCVVTNVFSQNLSNKQVFPTPESPIINSFAIKSYELLGYLLIVICYLIFMI